ncbi:hypothetical protein N7457_003747 [Penicillium paradoxum]|uniref:uncharacterized protein n=1 Tax=Penicillium paradoxum TaxID=176176 RepID=UPI002547871B|nr:uncharacterized protein N7457_003747 [Penicillium paradoxum]KAJ5788757.1 hypothetical protein N7457_003747 [Penicillium paradoxum]
MSEETRWCYVCRRDKPILEFQAHGVIGKEFYKLCEPCRTKSRNAHRERRHRKWQTSRNSDTEDQRHRGQPYYLHEPVNQTNINISNGGSRIIPTTNGGTANAMPEPSTCLQADPNNHTWFTIAPPVVENSVQGTTTKTVITISTTTTKSTTDPLRNSENHTKTEEGETEQTEGEDLELSPSEFSSEQPSDTEPDIKQRPELFGCLHCEKLRPWPMAALHICMMCIRDWKWCAKGSHNRAKANFLWNGEEHDECYMCYFTGE